MSILGWDNFLASLGEYSLGGIEGLPCRSEFNRSSGLRLVVVESVLGGRRWLDARWREASCGNCRVLLLLVAGRGSSRGSLCYGWGGENLFCEIVEDDLTRLAAVCERALAERRELVVWDRLEAAFEALGKESRRREAILGCTHGELFSRHYMGRRAWGAAVGRDGSLGGLLRALKDEALGGGEGAAEVAEGGELLRLLGFDITDGGDRREAVLSSAGVERAFALVLRAGDRAEHSVAGLSDRRTAAGYAIEAARERGLPFALVVAGSVLRLYVRRGFGEGNSSGDTLAGDALAGDFSEQRFLETDVALAKAVWRQARGGDSGEGRGEEHDEKHDEKYEMGLRAVAMLFSGIALAGGAGKPSILGLLLSQSRSYVEDVAESLRRRIYNDVMPDLAKALVDARGIKEPNREELDETYEMAMRVLFRLLFVGYAEDKGLIPSADERQEEEEQDGEQRDLLQEQQAQKEYAKRSLKSKAQELAESLRLGKEKPFDDKNDKYWGEVNQLFKSIDKGDRQMGLPAYNGGLFVREEREQNIALKDNIFAPILQKLLLEESDENAWGPVDFADLSVREFGTIYEGLLESELSYAEEALTADKKSGLYRPMRGVKQGSGKQGSEVVVEAGNIYVHNTSGARKATGSYYTPDFCVEHLLEGSLLPALDAHFARIDERLNAREQINGEIFFDLRVADIAMGSGHFLVAAAGYMAQRFADYYKQHRGRLSGVATHLEELRTTAERRLRDVSAPVPRSLRVKQREKKGAKQGEKEKYWEGEEMLLRRQVVGRCVYGVDRNELAVQLARVSLWIHSFVPGLPLSYLDRNLLCGDSLVGVGTMAEIEDKVRAEGGRLGEVFAEEFLGDAKEALHSLAQNAQSSVKEVKKAEEEAEEIRDNLRPSEVFCDVMTAMRIDPKQPNVDISRWRQKKKELYGGREHRNAQDTLKGLKPIHFPVAFPEVFLRERQGFDVILGNPPWDKIFADESVFWTRYISGFKGYPQDERKKLVKQRKEDYPTLVDLLEQEKDKQQRLLTVLNRGTYGEKDKGFGSGHPDLHKVFAWRYWQLLVEPQGERNQGGHLGIVVPRSLLNSEGSKGFRKTIFRSTQYISITTILNKNKWCFTDLHGQYVVVLLAFQKNLQGSDAIIAMHPVCDNRPTFDTLASAIPIEIKMSEATKSNTTATLPSFTSPHSPAVFSKLRLSPSLGLDDPSSWRTRPYQELNATTDQPFMDMKMKQSSKDKWPVYKGESFDIWQADTGSYYAWAQPQPIMDMLQRKRLRRVKNSPSSEFSIEDIKKPETLPCLSPRIAFRLITNATNTRTMICSLIPPKVFCQNSAPVFLFPRGDEREQTYLLGILCSRPLDWFARRFVELNMNHHIINNFPIPRPSRADPLRLRVIELAGLLACQDARLQAWATTIGVASAPLDEVKKQEMTTELDAIAAHLYGLSREQLKHIFATFHEGWQSRPDYKPTLAQTLAHYDAWHTSLGKKPPPPA